MIKEIRPNAKPEYLRSLYGMDMSESMLKRITEKKADRMASDDGRAKVYRDAEREATILGYTNLAKHFGFAARDYDMKAVREKFRVQSYALYQR